MVRSSSLFLLVAALLSGCASFTVMSHVPMSTMSRLASLDVAEIAPSDLRVAARLPSTLEPRPGGAKVQLVLQRGNGDEKYEFVLQGTEEPSETAALASRDKPGFRIWTYRLVPADVARLDQIRAQAVSTHRWSTLSISAGVDACRRGPLPSGPIHTSTYLRIDASAYFTMVEDLDLRSIVSARDLAAKVPAC